MGSYAEYVQAEVRKDLAAFADPGTMVTIVPSGSGMTARWVQNDAEHEILLSRSQEEFPAVEIQGRKMSYRGFLASEHMADLKRLAGMMVRIGYGVKDFVETRAVPEPSEDGGTPSPGKATDLIRQLATGSLPWGATRVTFVRGPAGCGKTYILRKLAEEQALEYELGEVDKLFFYVDAQGKALARFDEAIAKELQDLRAPFTYHAVAPLTRRHCLVVIVDGFDELLGSGGYDEAFASLSNFLGQLGGEGSLVASARSTFYDYKGFRRTVQRFAAGGAMNYVVEPIDVQLWEKDEVVEYFGRLSRNHPERFKHTEDVYGRLIGRAGGRNRELLKKPFYVAKIADLYVQGRQVDQEKELLTSLVDFFTEREAEKVKDIQGRPILTKEDHVRLLIMLAEEMWWQETRQVDIPTVQTLAELLAEERKLSPLQVNTIVERAPTNAFLASRGNGGRKLLGFEHEVYYSYFLGRRLEDALLGSGADLREFLSRATLFSTVVDEVLGAQTWAPSNVETCVQRLGESLSGGALEAVARENAGKIVAALIQGRDDLPQNLAFRQLVLKQAGLKNTVLVRPKFENCYFEELDLEGARFIDPEFPSTTFNLLKIDPKSTRLERAHISLSQQVFGLCVYGATGLERLHNPAAMARALESVGAFVEGYEANLPVEYSRAARSRIELLDRFLLYANKTFYISTDEPRLRQVFGAHEWKVVRQLLYKHHIVEDVVREKSGPRQDLMRLHFRPDMIREGEYPSPSHPEEIVGFWKELLAD